MLTDLEDYVNRALERADELGVGEKHIDTLEKMIKDYGLDAYSEQELRDELGTPENFAETFVMSVDPGRKINMTGDAGSPKMKNVFKQRAKSPNDIEDL